MDTGPLLMYVMEARFQCEFVLVAHRQLRQAQTLNEYWYSLQNLLVGAANLGKLAWGSRGDKEQERIDFRVAIGMADHSTLHDPDLRNDFEHFDSRIDAYYLAHPTWGAVGRNIGLSADYFEGSDRFPHYDPKTGEVTFFKHSASIPAIVAEVENLLPRVNAAMFKLMREYGNPHP